MYRTFRHISIATAILAGAGSTSAQTIRILSADYGNPNASGGRCDATKPVAALCNGMTHCTVNVRNSALCGDPDFLVVKQSRIHYTCGRHVAELVVSEYSDAEISCR